MIERLRRKFIVISMCSIFLVLSIIVTFINISNYYQMSREADKLLSILAENNGYFPKADKVNGGPKPKHPELSPEAPFSTRFFTVTADRNQTILTVDTGKVAAATTKEATDFAAEVLKKGNTKGFIEVYRYHLTSKEYGTLLVFVDCRREIDTFQAFLKSSILISAIGLFSIFLLVLFLSKKAIKPVAESYGKQKRFITDAGHELKTPLAIIAANTEVLEMDYGENEWTRSIYNQISRMTELTANLVTLARMDEIKSNLQMAEFSLSDAVLESAEPFISLVRTQEKELDIKIEKNLSYCGNEPSIRQLVFILMDNAVKYSLAGSKIELSLKSQGRHIYLSTCNVTEYFEQSSLDALFERFYRADSSRSSQTGGYGIGLSIAKAIVTRHKGKIKAESSDGKSIIITAQL